MHLLQVLGNLQRIYLVRTHFKLCSLHQYGSFSQDLRIGKKAVLKFVNGLFTNYMEDLRRRFHAFWHLRNDGEGRVSNFKYFAHFLMHLLDSLDVAFQFPFFPSM